MSASSNYYTQNSSQGQQSPPVNYSSWDTSQDSNQQFQSLPTPPSSYPSSPPPPHFNPNPNPNEYRPKMLPPISSVMNSNIPDAKYISGTKLKLEHFQNNIGSDDDNESNKINTNEHGTYWFWFVLFIGIIILIAIGCFYFNNDKNNVGQTGANTNFGSGSNGVEILDDVMGKIGGINSNNNNNNMVHAGIGGGGILNDLEYL